MDRDGLTAFYHKDGLGSITKLSDISQNEIASYTYDVFGSLRSQTGSINNPYLFTSRRLDIETGLYYYRARYYNSNTGRFISRDPLLYGYTSNLGCNSCSNSLIPQRISGLKPSLTPQNLHPYVYVTNNPVNLVDPLGLCECEKVLDWGCFAACMGAGYPTALAAQCEWCLYLGNAAPVVCSICAAAVAGEMTIVCKSLCMKCKSDIEK